MKNKVTILLGICLLFFVGSSLLTPASSYADDKETDVGIRFTEGSTSINPPSSDVPHQEPGVTKPTTKPTGKLPNMGELMQPVILLLVGWLVVIVGMAIFLSSKKTNNNKEE